MDKISVTDLFVGYRSPILSDICFNVKGGEIMVIIGPNGAGKSTVLKTLAGELEKISGDVYLCGEKNEKYSLSSKAKLLSALLTERINARLMTCREVVETGRYPYTNHFGSLSDDDKAAVDEAMKFVGISDLAEKYFSAVSDGQRQRVALAAAICREPEILILDEPTSYLDIHHKIVFLEALRSYIKEKNIAVVLSMHELELAREIADYAVCVKDGGVFKAGSAKEIFTRDILCSLFDITDEMYNRYYGK